MLADGLGVDQQAVERAPADGVVQDRGDLVLGAAGPFGDLRRPPRRRGSARGAGPPADSPPWSFALRPDGRPGRSRPCATFAGGGSSGLALGHRRRLFRRRSAEAMA